MSKHVGNRNFVAGGKFRQQSCGSQHLCGWVGKQHQDVWIETDGSNIQQSTWREFLRAAGEGRSVIVIAVELVEPASKAKETCLVNQTVQVAPVSSPLANAKPQMGVSVRPYSLTSFDLLLEASKHASIWRSSCGDQPNDEERLYCIARVSVAVGYVRTGGCN